MNLPSWFNRSFSTSFHYAFRFIYQVALTLYNLMIRNNTIIPISSNYNAFWEICLIIIFGTLYFYRLRYFDLGRSSRIVHQSSAQWMISTSRVVTPRATWNLRPSHGVSTPIWLCSVNCYCFAPHHKSFSLLSLFSVSTLFPKIISRCICRMAMYA